MRVRALSLSEVGAVLEQLQEVGWGRRLLEWLRHRAITAEVYGNGKKLYG